MKLSSHIRTRAALAMAAVMLLTSCSSSTLIQSTPSNARVYLNGQRVGSTPYTMSDLRPVGSCTSVRIEKEGYETLHRQICRDEEIDVAAVVGGFFVLVPFLWAMKYYPVHHYDLQPLTEDTYVPAARPAQPSNFEIKTAKLRELKALYDEGILSKEEYETEKRKVLDEL